MTNPALASALFSPRRIALIGASTDANRLTARAQVYLRRHGFAGELFPVNPRAETVLGEPAYKSLARAVAAFSRLAALAEVTEAEINPVIVLPEGLGVVMADALLVRGGARDAH